MNVALVLLAPLVLCFGWRAVEHMLQHGGHELAGCFLIGLDDRVIESVGWCGAFLLIAAIRVARLSQKARDTLSLSVTASLMAWVPLFVYVILKWWGRDQTFGELLAIPLTGACAAMATLEMSKDMRPHAGVVLCLAATAGALLYLALGRGHIHIGL